MVKITHVENAILRKRCFSYMSSIFSINVTCIAVYLFNDFYCHNPCNPFL